MKKATPLSNKKLVERDRPRAINEKGIVVNTVPFFMSYREENRYTLQKRYYRSGIILAEY